MLVTQKSKRARKTKLPNGLTVEMERFCQLYSSKEEYFGNGVASYAKATGKNINSTRQYRVAAVMASKWLSRPEVLARIDELIKEMGLNDQFIDKQLWFLIAQKADPSVSIAGIREYNRMRGRITNRNINFNGKVPEPLLGGDSRKAK